jgi:hypothetical protein
LCKPVNSASWPRYCLASYNRCFPCRVRDGLIRVCWQRRCIRLRHLFVPNSLSFSESPTTSSSQYRYIRRMLNEVFLDCALTHRYLYHVLSKQYISRSNSMNNQSFLLFLSFSLSLLFDNRTSRLISSRCSSSGREECEDGTDINWKLTGYPWKGFSTPEMIDVLTIDSPLLLALANSVRRISEDEIHLE